MNKEALMIRQLRSIVFHYPVISGLVVMLAAALLTELPLSPLLAPYMGKQGADYLTGYAMQASVSTLLILLLAALGMLREGGFTRIQEWRSVWLVWPILGFMFLNNGSALLDGSLRIDTGNPLVLGLFVLLYLSVGVFEEVLLRSFVLRLMLRKWGTRLQGVYLAVLLSSLFFGGLHIINYFAGRQTLLATLTQMTFGTFFGVFFAACFLRNRSILPVVLSHALFDMCGNLPEISIGGAYGTVITTTPEDALLSVLVTLPLFLYGLFLLRKVKPIESEDTLPVERLDAVTA